MGQAMARAHHHDEQYGIDWVHPLSPFAPTRGACKRAALRGHQHMEVLHVWSAVPARPSRHCQPTHYPRN